TRHIGAVLVDPRNAKTVLVAALGHVFGPNAERGVYRSDDGGQTWSRTLFVDEQTGAVDLAADPAEPDTIYATTWAMRGWPWQSYFTPQEGPGSAIYRSHDGGRTWARLGGEGWPAGALGRIGIAVARVGAATRIYASVAQQDRGGFYRSDDSGAHWQKVNAADWVTTWYMSRLTVSPGDPDVVYTCGQSIHMSRDGGKTFTIMRGAPGGDDFHYLWINPRAPERMVAASDQGVIVTLNGGETWSDWYNQPTAQVYYLATDDRFPYWIYTGQQDSGTVGITSRSDYGAISFRDWRPVGGDERDYDVPDPEDPNIVYGSGLGGRITRWDARTGEAQTVTPWPVNGYGKRPTNFRYHGTWFAPLAVSKQKPYALYAGAQLLFRSLDRGTTWETISPDLSGGSADAKECAGDLPPERAFECGYGTVFAIAPSRRDNNEIWIGTDAGLVWLTRDGGRNWRRVTPPGVPVWAKVSSIDLAAAPGTAYVAVDNHRQDDFRPHVLRTRDYGATWTELSTGLPPDHFVSVVRADPVRPGLLFAGTELGACVSFDDGEHWQSLQRNLPPAWVHDLLVKDRDLIAATQGRGIWVLDDLAPLRQGDADDRAAARLYRPSPAYRLRVNQNRDTPLPPETPLGRNPPTGAVIDYWLARNAKTPVVLEVRDAAGQLVRRFGSADSPERLGAERYFSEDWVQPAPRLSNAAGAHRFVWDLRLPRPRAVEYQYGIAASRNEGTPIVPAGALVLPGEYRLTLAVDGRRYEAPLTVTADPRVATPAADLAAALQFYGALSVDLERAWRGHAEIAAIGKQLDRAAKSVAMHAALAGPLADFRKRLVPLSTGEGEQALNFAAASETLAAIATDVENADRAPTAPQREVARLMHERVDTATARWEAIKRSDLPALNAALVRARLPKLAVPDAEHLGELEAPGSLDLP
ncbi:MAG: hypothetical protein WCE48_00005, partial [Steroidobacteraceae bacterium]